MQSPFNIRELKLFPRQQSLPKLTMAPKEQPESLKEVAVDSPSSTTKQVVRVPPVLVSKSEEHSRSGSLSSFSSLMPLPAKDIKKSFRVIRDSKVAEEVEEALTLMAMTVNTDENDQSSVETAVQTIITMDGVGTVLMALKDWYATSVSIAAVAIPLLLKLCVLSDEKTRLFVANVGLPTLVAAGNAHKTNGSVTCGVIGILSVICEVHDEFIKEEIANDDCLDLCIHAMKQWPNEPFVQSCCCLYLSNISVDNKKRLCEKEVGVLILAALEKFRDREDKTVYRRAFRAMTLYISE